MISKISGQVLHYKCYNFCRRTYQVSAIMRIFCITLLFITTVSIIYELGATNSKNLTWCNYAIFCVYVRKLMRL